MIPLPFLVILLIVPVALVDYFAFRNQFKKIYGEPMKWNYFVVPCALELGCFAAGYLMGAAS